MVNFCYRMKAKTTIPICKKQNDIVAGYNFIESGTYFAKPLVLRPYFLFFPDKKKKQKKSMLRSKRLIQ